MSDAIWSFHRLKRERFAAAALALSSMEKQQVIPAAAEGPNIDDEELSDDESLHPRDLVASGGQLKLQKKFLNRLSEVIARQKTSKSTKPKPGTPTDAGHVSAAILGFRHDIPLVYVAKNEGFDTEDKRLLRRLQIWLRAVSLDGRRRSVTKDGFWSHLVEYNRSRLEFYVSGLAGSAKKPGDAVSVQELQVKCKEYTDRADSCRTLSEVIDDAFLLRYKSSLRTESKVVRLIGLLSRLRAAWETFQEFAMHDTYCKDICIDTVDSSEQVKIPVTSIRSELEGLRRGLSGRVQMGSAKKPWKHLTLHTHAECQLLLLVGRYEQPNSSPNFVRYMGSSKKTCWLCEQTLRYQAGFSSRGSHGELTPHWTIETNHSLEPRFLTALIEGMCYIESRLVGRVCGPKGPHRTAVPQSTPDVTSDGSAITIAKMGHRRKGICGIDRTMRDDISQVLGSPLRRISATRLLSADIEAQFTELDICENISDLQSMSPTSGVPDFRRFWGTVLHTDQDHYMLDVEENENEANDGRYMIFYNTSEELPHNECIANMLGLNEGSLRALENRLFWKGDVFVVRFDDMAPGGGALLSLRPGADMQDVLRMYFRYSWEHQDLEASIESRLQLSEFSEIHSRNRELIRARL